MKYPFIIHFLGLTHTLLFKAFGLHGWFRDCLKHQTVQVLDIPDTKGKNIPVDCVKLSQKEGNTVLFKIDCAQLRSISILKKLGQCYLYLGTLFGAFFGIRLEENGGAASGLALFCE